MSLATVNTKRSSLKVYNTTITSDVYYVTSLPIGEVVDIDAEKTVNNIIWAHVTSNSGSGWVVKKHPSVTYSYLEDAGPALYAMGDTTTSSSVRNTTSSGSGGYYSGTYSGMNLTTTGTKRETTGRTMDSYASHSTVEVTPSEFKMEEVSGSRNRSDHANKDADPPWIIQNSKGFPKLLGYDTTKGRYAYSYEMDYTDNALSSMMQNMRKSNNLELEDQMTLYDRKSKYYNRFKVATPNDVLIKTFSHVFFTRPECNIIENIGGNNFRLCDTVSGSQDFITEFQRNKPMLMQLSRNVNLPHRFMMIPSNQVSSFETRDRQIKTDTYGRTLHGNSIAYGRTIDESQAASEMSISFTEDCDLHLTRMHQLWVEYIDGCYKGRFRPSDAHLMNRELDYACSVYYFVTGPDGETILYWSKIYGVFPTNIPDSVFGFTKGNTITNPEISISYQYSLKRDMKIATLHEFNLNAFTSGNQSYEYAKTYDKNVLGTGYTWVGAPFVEAVQGNRGLIYKLRFKPS